MAKADKFKRAGLVPDEANADDFTEGAGALLGDAPAWEGSMSASKPLEAPDGHVTLSAGTSRRAADGHPRTASPRRRRQPHDRLR